MQGCSEAGNDRSFHCTGTEGKTGFLYICSLYSAFLGTGDLGVETDRIGKRIQFSARSRRNSFPLGPLEPLAQILFGPAACPISDIRHLDFKKCLPIVQSDQNSPPTA